MKNAFISVFVRNNKEIQSLNGLRALAIIFILILHTKVVITTTQQNVPDIFLILLENLRSGVDLFFILSGFLISSGLYLNFKKDGKINYKNFYIKRSLRIFPAYYFYLLISFLIVSLQVNNLPEGSHERYLAEKGLQYVIYDFIYLTNYFPSLNAHTWSLSIEEQFYLIFPLIASIFIFRMTFRKRIISYFILYFTPLIIRIMIAIYFRENITPDIYHKFIYKPFHTRFDAFIAGIMLMDLYYNSDFIKNLSEKTIRILLPAGMILFLIGHLAFHFDQYFLMYPFSYTFYHAAYGIWFLLALNGKSIFAKMLNSRVFIPIARVSYGIYLWHFIIGLIVAAAIMGNFAKGMNMGISQLILFIFLSLILNFAWALFLYVIVEYPFLYLKKRLTGN